MKKRLDVLLTETEIISSREKAKVLIMTGLVIVNGLVIDKPGTLVDEESIIEVKTKPYDYVSRGGQKLKKALLEFGIELKDKIVADIGASTGGFTDCMLEAGALKVYAVDVGYGQLAWELRNDKRVVVLERTNARYLTSNEIPDLLDFISIDVSFISLTLLLKTLINLLKDKAGIVMLIKPQFEAGREKIEKNGVIKNKDTHIEVIERIIEFCNNNCLGIKALTYSPVKGPKGNIEFLLYAVINEKPEDIDVTMVVNTAHESLNI